MSKKILMATMGLDIGGAETHIVELSKELKRKGYDIAVASNGGVFVPELEQAGIRHYQVPMNRRSVMPMLKSYFKLGRVIKTERPDVVHAHARIPGFICHLLKKRLKFPFVTTAHWVFATSGMQGILTRWGQKTVAVSEDIKIYLKDNYGVKDEDIFVTINGIATDKFSREISGDKIKAEFDIDPNLPVICNVSRLDADRALAAETLIDAAGDIREKIGDYTLLIVGDGTEGDRLRAKARAAQSLMGTGKIVMAGARTDINELIAACDIFAGVSRAALEAMACEKPVILAGNEGYEGIFTKDKLETAVNSNFCCRGGVDTTVDVITRDIAAIMAMSEQERAALGNDGRDIILEHYSVSRMAGDSEKAYLAALKGSKKILMSGYYGFNNAGDESILQTIHNGISALEEVGEITVLSKNPESTRSRYGYNAVNRMGLFSMHKAIRRCDVLISGGGSLLQDKTSTRSIIYYLYVIRYALRRGKKVMLYANGVGPVDKPKNRQRVQRVLEQVDVITLRDPVSTKELLSMGVPEEKLHTTVDPVFLMETAPYERAQEILENAGVSPDEPFITVSVRSWSGDFRAPLAAACDRIQTELGCKVVFLAMQHPSDLEVCRDVLKRMKNPGVLIEEFCTGAELMGIEGLARVTISMRLHSLIFSACAGTPVVGLVYDPKLQSYLDMLGMPSAGSVETLSCEAVMNAVSDAYNRREELAAKLAAALPELKKLAEKNQHYLKDLI
ncbi:MAG: polysaccharide pyruvyl transferase CsaB [Oscillospiraceae bacterium]|nr:polysaccharide pyruvyl transferase CsaB [Oscillospiraceae bacterium]